MLVFLALIFQFSCHIMAVQDVESVGLPGIVETAEGWPSCSFPEWATSMGSLLDFQFTSRYEFIQNGDFLLVSNYSSTNRKTNPLSQTSCVSIVEEDENSVKMVTSVITDCIQAYKVCATNVFYKCFRMLKRTDNIVEIQEGATTVYENMACTQHNFDKRIMTYTTLFREGLQKQECPINGIHNVTELDLDGHNEICEGNGFTSINVKCGDKFSIEFSKKCPNPEKLMVLEKTASLTYHCLGGWQEQISKRTLPDSYYSRQASRGGGLFASNSSEDSLWTPRGLAVDERDFGKNITIGFVIAMRSDKPLDQAEHPNHQTAHKKRICFRYSTTNGPYGSGEGATYSWTVDKTGCLRNIRLGHHAARQRFNTSLLETCGASLFQRTTAEQVWWTTFTLLSLLSCGAAKL